MITEFNGIYDYESENLIKLMIIFILDDKTDVMKVSLFGEMCTTLLNLTEREQEEIIAMSPLERMDSFLLANKINNLIGKEIIVRGTVEKNEYTNLLELKAKVFYAI